jgi:DNA replication protein DnaC
LAESLFTIPESVFTLAEWVFTMDRNECSRYRGIRTDFEFDAQPSSDQYLMGRLATLRFLEDGTNALLLGPPGVGKTALAIGLALKALEAGHRIFFIHCHDLVGRLRKAIKLDRLDNLLSAMICPKLLILDEIGYTPLERSEATFLFEIVAKRYATIDAGNLRSSP